VKKRLLLISTAIVVVLIGIALFFYRNPSTRVSNLETIVEGLGWKSVVLGNTRKSVIQFLGKPDNTEYFNTENTYFDDYYSEGIQINYNKLTNRVRSIFFYFGQIGNELYSNINRSTQGGISAKSTETEVLTVFGKPIQDSTGICGGVTCRRIVYKGIDFRFEENKLVRISVF
jgi:hypothetical protein